ncbi:MAG TPA: AAC(3) family N-acetyltransferase [Steroidobacteraceae bacterium]|nr:AAC(3) family N-acetyltransferase [Steroidobacteraceae bacterium]
MTRSQSHPKTRESLARDFAELGVASGMTVMVHASLGKVGWTEGGPIAVIRALLESLGPQGTLVMPAESPAQSDPQQPIFDPRTTPTTMGAIAEAFRSFPGTLRSHHPLVSVCANGRNAGEITRDHALAFCEGKGTPFERLYELHAFTLLLGVGFDRCTSLHYAESLTPSRRTTVSHFAAMRDGERIWMEVPDMAPDNGVHFPVVGAKFAAGHSIRTGRVGNADAMLFSTRELVDFAAAYFNRTLERPYGAR